MGPSSVLERNFFPRNMSLMTILRQDVASSPRSRDGTKSAEDGSNAGVGSAAGRFPGEVSRETGEGGGVFARGGGDGEVAERLRFSVVEQGESGRGGPESGKAYTSRFGSE